MNPQHQAILIAGTGFFSNNWPRLKCDQCNEGILEPIPKHPVHIQESQLSLSWRNHDGFEPDWIYGIFHGLLKCTACREFAAVSGDMQVDMLGRDDPGYTDHAGPPWKEKLTLRYINPAISIFDSPQNCPQEIRDRMTDAARVIFQDPSAAANRIRVAIETFLDLQKISRYPPTGPRAPISTHRRIKKFALKRPDVGQLLEAVKWIGNHGAHEASVDLLTALNGAEFFSLAMNLMYDKTSQEIQRRATEVNRRKGKPRRTPAKS